mgnify:CR=1 FL=1|tara:strand:+ start:7358 stop:7807 length:450 start_codon:yes stop_codon:yes gene_type:complete
MTDKVIEIVRTEYKDDIMICFNMVNDRIKKQDVEDFLLDLENLYKKLIEDKERVYFIWNIKLLSVLPPSYLKCITNYMPRIRELGRDTTKGTAVLFWSSTVRGILNKYIKQYGMDADFIKFVKNYDLGIEYLKELGLNTKEKEPNIAYA